MVNSRKEQVFLDQLHTMFSSLQQEEVEQFYAAYRQWLLQQHIVELRQQLAALQERIGENELLIQQYRPSPIALASIARLQANGVSDIDLLDQMLERGEAWLDSTMQRLDYVEQFENFLSDDYTQWCRRALEGAFDWMDSLLIAGTTPSPATAVADAETVTGEDAGEAEAILLQKLATEADDYELAGEEPTLKQAAAKLPAQDGVRQVAIDAAPLETEKAATSEEPETSKAETGEEKQITPDETSGAEEEITASEAPTGDEALAADTVPVSAQDTPPSEEPHISEVSAPAGDEVEDGQPAVYELTPVEEAEANGATDIANEQPPVNGREEQPSPAVPMSQRRKHSIIFRLIVKLLGG